MDGGAAMSAPTRIGRYEIVRRLGKSMTEVYLARDPDAERLVALKLVPMGGDTVNRLILEAERRGAAIQKELRSADPRIVEVYDFGEYEGWFYVAMQYVEGRNLSEVLRAESAMEPVRAASIALEICEQLAKFHGWREAVVHGDIKPSNIHLGRNDTVRLLDFGIAKTLRADCSATGHQFGSPGYCSPERLARSEVDQQSDLWAVGATLYEMLAGVPPYQAESTRKLEAMIRSRRPPRALGPGVPRALRLIVSKAMAPNPGQRYASAGAFQTDLQAFLEHRPTQAEIERRTSWAASMTIEAAREALRKATQTVARARRRLQVAGAFGWFAVGMALWIGGSYGWQVLEARPSIPDPPAPPRPRPSMPLLYRAEGERVLALKDWTRAELLLERAVELGDTDGRLLSELAMAHANAHPKPVVVVVAPPPAPAPAKAVPKRNVRPKTSARARRPGQRWR
jgi:hypothetical protein